MGILLLAVGVVGLIVVLGAFSVDWATSCTITETLSGNTDSLASGSASAVITHSAFNEAGTINTDTVVPATKHSSFVMALDTGAYTIDLSAAPSTNNALIDATGLKLQILRIKNLGANAMTFEEGASDGYAIGSSIVVPVGGIVMCYFADALPNVASGDKTIDVAGTGAQTAEITMVFG